METFSGIVRFMPLEGGFWQLASDDGQTYHLVGNLKGLKNGSKVSIEGRLEKKRLSFAMVGAILYVQSVVLQK